MFLKLTVPGAAPRRLNLIIMAVESAPLEASMGGTVLRVIPQSSCQIPFLPPSLPNILQALSLFFFLFLFYIGVCLIYSVVLVSDVQQSESVTHVHISILFSHTVYYKSVPCVIYSSLLLSILFIVVRIC